MFLFTAASRLIRHFLPMDCPVCGKISADGSANGFCAECLARLELVRPPYCPGCGGTMEGSILDMCSACMRSEAARPWKKAFSLYEMSGFGRELIHLFKYGNRPELATPLAHLIRMRFGDAIREEHFDCIVPAPLFWLRQVQRGYNQAEVLSKRIGAELDLPVESLLRRVKWTKQQAK